MTTLHDKIVASHPKLARGEVWCRKCGAHRKVDAGNSLRHGWPECCGHTMTIDAPNERERHAPLFFLHQCNLC